MTSPLSRRRFLQASTAGAASTLGALALPALAASAATPKPAARPFGAPDADTVYIGANECPYGPSKAAIDAMVAIAPYGSRYLGPLQQRARELFAQQSGISQDHVVAYAGSSEPLEFVTEAFSSATAAVVTADPTYENPWRVAARTGAPLIKVPLRKDFSHDVQAMCRASDSAGMLYICNPNNPTGSMTTRADIEYALAHKPKGSVLVVDEAYIHYSDAVSVIDLVGEGADLIVLRTFSKLYGMAGVRMGFAAGRPDLLQKMLLIFSANNVPVTAAAAAIASLEDAQLVPQRKAQNTRIRQANIDWLTARGHACTTSESNCFMVDVGRPAKAFATAMAAKGVMVGRGWDIWPTWSRISVGTEAEMTRFRQAFAQVMG